MWTLFVSLSVITRIMSWPLDLARGPTKSMAISENRSCGIGSGWRYPAGDCVLDLFAIQVGQDLTYFSASAASQAKSTVEPGICGFCFEQSDSRCHDVGIAVIREWVCRWEYIDDRYPCISDHFQSCS